MDEAGKTRADEAGRLEAALERIARSRPTAATGQTTASAADTADLARRLDALIADLRSVLGLRSAD